MTKDKKQGRSRRKEGYYTRVFARTEANKLRRKRKRLARRDGWRLKGVKKNGAPVAQAIVA